MNNIDPQALTIALQQLAGIANLNSLSAATVLPDGWDLVVVFPAPPIRPMPFPEVQGFVAQGVVEEGDDPIAVLALGINWANFQLNYSIGKLLKENQIPLRSVTAMGGKNFPQDGMIDTTTINSYLTKRAAIWNAISKVSSLPLYICGMSLGAPMAQLAALDLQPGNKGPGGQDAPDTQPPGYYFSAGNVVNASFANYYNGAIPNQFAFSVNKPGLTIDYFPTAPVSADFAVLGKATSISAAIPPYDDPWWERSSLFYTAMLGGSPDELPAQPGNISNPPAGYSQPLAYTLANLCAIAYQTAQHPDLAPSGFGSFTRKAIINSGGSPFAFIFSNDADAVVLAFRGSTSWDEFTSFVASSNDATVPFDPDPAAHARQGPYNIYYAKVNPDDAKSPVFAAALKTALLPLLSGGQKLYLTGHCVGGALANLAAADYVMTPGSGITPTVIYTFGATMLADLRFAEHINAKLAAQSYQIVRQKDKIANAVSLLGFFPLQNQLILTGQMAFEEATYHAITGYITLLNPNATAAAQTDYE